MKIGLALSGGGAKGIAHAGVIKALKERNIKISKITGTSAGAVIGALYAADLSVSQILDFFQKSNLFHPRTYAFNQAGFIKSSMFQNHISNFIPENSFESLTIPLSITATDLHKVKLKVFTQGELYNPILASAAYPGIFTPVEINDNIYVDGGVINNFPVDLLSDCDFKIGSYVNKVEILQGKRLKRSYDVASRAFAINQYAKDMHKFILCDILIEPSHIQDYGLFSFRSLGKMLDLGYETASKQLDKAGL